MMQPFTADTWPRDRWPSFTFREIACRETGLCYMEVTVMDQLQELRRRYDLPMTITSGYRAPTHSVEAAKERPGSHPTGKAFDVQVSGHEAYGLLQDALALGFTGIGIKQHGPHDERFLHLDLINPADGFHAPRPWIWSYS